MELYTLKINVTNQRLSFGENPPEIYSGDQSIDFVEFTFTDDTWNFPDIWAIFYRQKGAAYQIALDDNKVMIPAEVMQKRGYVYIGLMATDGDNVQTSSVLQYSIRQGAANVDTITPSPSIYEQFLADLDAYQEAIQNLSNLSAVAETLAPGSSATASYLNGVLTLGIPQGATGATGNGIQSITKTGTSGSVDTYTITYTNGQTTTFTVTNGEVTQAALDAVIQPLENDVDDLKSDIYDVFDAHFYKSNLATSDSVASRGISNSGGVAYDADKTARLYPVTEGELLYLNLSANTGTTTAVWIFTTATTVGSMSSGNLVGTVHFDAIDGMVRVPTGATRLAVAQPTSDTTFNVQKVIPKDYQKEIDNISYGAYENVKGDFEIGSILNGANVTVTTRIRHAKPVSYDRDVFIFVKGGYKFYIAFYSDAQGASYINTKEFVTNNLPICIGANQYFRMVICKETEVVVTSIDEYINALYVSTELFNNPQIYKNPIVCQVAHQGYNLNPVDGVGHSLLSAYDGAMVAGFTHGETDIQFTSDNIPVCCHDATFTDQTSGTTITIADHTYSELQSYNYYGGKIASFEDVVKRCKTNGLGLYIDHLDVSFTDTQWQMIFEAVHKFGMEKNVVWLITSQQVADKILAWDANANFSFVIASTSLWDYALEVCSSIKTATNEVSIDVFSTVFPVSTIENYISQLPVGVSLEVWTVDNISDWKSYLPYVTGITSNAICANIARKLL